MSKPVHCSPWPQALQPNIPFQIAKNAWGVITTLSGSTPLHNLVAPRINPAISKDPATIKKLNALRVQLLQGDNAPQIVNIQSADGIGIEGVFYAGNSKNAILFAPGAGGCFEAIADPSDPIHNFVQFFREKLGGVNVLVINPRGVGTDRGTHAMQGCALDYYAAWSFLEAEGMKVLPWGHSLGFVYLVQAASWKQDENPLRAIPMVSDRSFDSVASVGKEMMGGGMKGEAVALLFQYAGWDCNVQNCWNNLEGKKLILFAPDDTTIPKTVSFLKQIETNPSSLDPNNGAGVIALPGSENAHTRIYNEDETKAIAIEVNKIFNPSSEQGTSPLVQPLQIKLREDNPSNRQIALMLLIGALAIPFLRRI